MTITLICDEPGCGVSTTTLKPAALKTYWMRNARGVLAPTEVHLCRDCTDKEAARYGVFHDDPTDDEGEE